jgi:hypothetical protein
MGQGSWWYSGEIDLGFSGALRTAATVVSDDPIFGLYAYGGELTRHGTAIEVIPRDGLRDRFDVVRGNARFQMQLDRDGFEEGKPITFSEPLNRFSFRIENRSHDQHETTLMLKGLPPGSYRVLSAGKLLSKYVITDGEEKNVKVTVSPSGDSLVTINRD